jgi:hypothetical protein
MTDYSELVKQLRQATDGFIHHEAADALEAQARRIAKLEAENKTLREALAPLLLADETLALHARIAELEVALTDVTVNLIGATSLLESGGKKAAPSNKMFEQMLVDYKNGIERARAALKGEK